MICILGLGNPGKQYRYTRHNAGFLFCDMLADRYNKEFEKGPGQYEWVQFQISNEDVVVVKPTTYMNRSGIAFDDLKKRFALLNSNCIIVFDDFHLSLGKIRIRPKGSDGGHNGLASVINYNHSMEIPRMRIGIGQPKHENIINFVLSDFTRNEKEIITESLENAVDAVFNWIEHGIEKTMSKFN